MIGVAGPVAAVSAEGAQRSYHSGLDRTVIGIAVTGLAVTGIAVTEIAVPGVAVPGIAVIGRWSSCSIDSASTEC